MAVLLSPSKFEPINPIRSLRALEYGEGGNK